MMHDENMKARYRDSNKFWKLGFEEKFLERIRRHHNECRRKIEKNEARIIANQSKFIFE